MTARQHLVPDVRVDRARADGDVAALLKGFVTQVQVIGNVARKSSQCPHPSSMACSIFFHRSEGLYDFECVLHLFVCF
jgi:hypothetical protein